MPATVTCAVVDGIATVTLNRPERLNAINPRLLEDLLAALTACGADKATKAIILTGAGRAFCAGDDLKEFGEQSRDEKTVRAYVEQIQDVTRAFLGGGKMVIGAINGWAVGGGLEWVINCDLVVMGEGCRCFFPEIGLGVFVTGGVTRLLPRLVGLAKARELILFGERFTAADALAMGIAWKVVPDGEVMATAMATARRIAALPQGAVADLRQVLLHAQDSDLAATLALETAATVRGFLDPESAERARAAIAGGRR